MASDISFDAGAWVYEARGLSIGASFTKDQMKFASEPCSA